MWGFPELLVDVIEKHHQEPPVAGPVETVEVVALANTVARILQVGSSGDTRKVERQPNTLARVGITADAEDRFFDEILSTVDEAREMLNLLD